MCKKIERNFQKKYIFVPVMRLLPYFYIVFLVFTTLFSVDSIAQQGPIFQHTEWDFGDIKEDGGKVKHSFSFRNTTNQPLSLVRVTANCGCTTPDYSREPVKVGGEGVIHVIYDPMDRPGRFSKNVIVETTTGDRITLVVSGNVLPRPKSIEELYPFDLGSGIKLSSNFHAFSYVGRGERVEHIIGWVNTSDREVKLRFSTELSSGLFTIEAPTTLSAGKSGELKMVYSVPASSHKYGTLNDVAKIFINGVESRIRLSANVIAVDHYDRMADDMSLPSLTLSKKIIKFAEVNRPQVAIDDSIILSNEGGSDLIIRAIELPEGVITSSLKAGDRIAAGESRKLKVTFNSRQCDYGPFSERIRIITNDVVRPMQSLRVTAIVIDK